MGVPMVTKQWLCACVCNDNKTVYWKKKCTGKQVNYSINIPIATEVHSWLTHVYTNNNNNNSNNNNNFNNNIIIIISAMYIPGKPGYT